MTSFTGSNLAGPVLILAMLLCAEMVRGAGLDWPAGRLLPAFPTPAATIDCIDVRPITGPKADLFASLEGIVNRTQPRIACVSGAFSEGKFAWLDLHHLHYSLIDGYAAIEKYKAEVTGLVVPDPSQPDTLNLATTLAGLNNELICAPSLLPVLTNAPYQLAIKDDLRGRFSNGYQVYQYLYTNCWPGCTHRIIAGMGGQLHGNLRDYLVAVKAATLWLNPKWTKDAAILSPFFADMTPVNAVYMGWWPNESAGLKWSGRHGIPVFASDYFDNGSLYGGIAMPVTAPAIPPPPPLQNKVYVSIILSDGDNVQYMQHHMKENWGNPDRGTVPIGWTVSPLVADFDPAMLNYYWDTSTTNDCLVSGPSGAGYARLDFWKTADMDTFTKISDTYFRRSGLRVATVWLHVTDAIGNAYATNCPTLLGITGQEGGSYSVAHLGLPTIGLAKNYEPNPAVILSGITNAAKKWNGTAPLFIAVQADGWHISPKDCQKIAAALDQNKYVVVRPDHLFQLCKSSRSALEADPQDWTNLLPPANLAGWTRVAIPPTNTLGRAQWHLDAAKKILICDGDGGHEMLRYDRELGDGILHVEFCFTPVKGTKARYNSGIFIRNSADGAIWHQAQVASDGGFIFGNTPVGEKLERVRMPLQEHRMKPAGEWNTMEVSARGTTLTVWLNGAPTSEFPNCEVARGYLALEAEGYRIKFRNLKLKEFPPVTP